MSSILKSMISETGHKDEGDLGSDIEDIFSKANKLDLFYKVGKTIQKEQDISELLNSVLQMTQNTLKATASSVILADEDSNKLIFEIAKGSVKSDIEHKKISMKKGIAAWVFHHGRPLIVNDVNNDARFNKAIDKSTGFITRSILCVPLRIGEGTIGVLEVLNKLDGSDFNKNDLELLTSLASFAALAINNAKLNEKLMKGYVSTIKVLSAAIDAKDPYTYGHSQRVTDYSLMAANTLDLSKEKLKVIEYAGILHDIGKIAIDEKILRKPGPLTSVEWKAMKTHPTVGANIINGVPFLEEARAIVLCHHEKYDGSGYPHGLDKDDIPIESCLVSVADAFDTMTTDRAYRSAVSEDEAIEELIRYSGTQFCPIAVEAMVAGLGKRRNF